MANTLNPSGIEWQSTLSVVIPAHNEVLGLARLLPEIRQKMPLAEIILVDDCSDDGTAKIAEDETGVRVLKHRRNRGYGASLKTGMRAATGENVAWIDADGEYAVDDLVLIARRIHDEDLDAVLTQRRQRSRSLTRFVGKWLVRALAQTLSSDQGRDGNSGLRVFRRDVIRRYLPLLPDGFSASTTSTLIMYERNHNIAIQPIDSNLRIGTSKVRLRDGFATLALVLRLIMLFAPLRIFLRVGAILVLGGGAYGLYRALFTHTGITVASAVIVIAGFLVWLLGLFADQVSHIRLTLVDLTAELAPGESLNDASRR